MELVIVIQVVISHAQNSTIRRRGMAKV